ncbi:hypothetical protein [Allorhizobium taibaishanense]|uniref:Uncharacterized protein n=1 Tax=Allorhizobium taibaishanense TaxID=887144 RepID=A0A7W6HJA1_9HYPH|nr:hypothetical protein [Allorhizobium taibaishanense]MBB4006261.1 hypothetical protein [Allorhizobium taibaishanense]
MVIDLELELFQEKYLAISLEGARQSEEMERSIFVFPLNPALAGPHQGIAGLR